MKKLFSTKVRKLAAVGGAVALSAGLASAAFAYFTSTGSGSGTGATGSSQAVTVVQDSIAYNGPGGSTNLMPGDTATVAFGITNPGGNEYVASISLASWTSNTPLTCDSSLTGQSGWFTMGTVTVGADFAHGTDLTTGKTGTITFNDDPTHDQTPCAGKTITFSYSSN